MSNRKDDQQHTEHKTPRGNDEAARNVSEGGSGGINPETALGGADAVPDTPDVNTEISDTVDGSEPGRTHRPRGGGAIGRD